MSGFAACWLAIKQSTHFLDKLLSHSKKKFELGSAKKVFFFWSDFFAPPRK